jgi:hypothetical protein
MEGGELRRCRCGQAQIEVPSEYEGPVTCGTFECESVVVPQLERSAYAECDADHAASWAQ